MMPYGDIDLSQHWWHRIKPLPEPMLAHHKKKCFVADLREIHQEASVYDSKLHNKLDITLL